MSGATRKSIRINRNWIRASACGKKKLFTLHVWLQHDYYLCLYRHWIMRIDGKTDDIWQVSTAEDLSAQQTNWIKKDWLFPAWTKGGGGSSLRTCRLWRRVYISVPRAAFSWDNLSFCSRSFSASSRAWVNSLSNLDGGRQTLRGQRAVASRSKACCSDAPRSPAQSPPLPHRHPSAIWGALNAPPSPLWAGLSCPELSWLMRICHKMFHFKYKGYASTPKFVHRRPPSCFLLGTLEKHACDFWV